MKKPNLKIDRVWYKAALTPAALGIFTESFYPTPKKGGAQYVYFTQVDVTPVANKVIVASRLDESGIRMMTKDLAKHCLIPKTKATRVEMNKLNELSMNLKT